VFLLLGVVAGSPESVLAIHGAKQAVSTLAIKDVPTIQASKACRNLDASELGVQPRVMAVQPQGKSFV
jgi:hypothetical protein